MQQPQRQQVVFLQAEAQQRSTFTFCPLISPLAEKDVNRTDRTNRFYEGIDNPGLVLLHDILMTYCMYDFDLGERKVLVANKSAMLDLWQVKLTAVRRPLQVTSRA